MKRNSKEKYPGSASLSGGSLISTGLYQDVYQSIFFSGKVFSFLVFDLFFKTMNTVIKTTVSNNGPYFYFAGKKNIF